MITLPQAHIIIWFKVKTEREKKLAHRRNRQHHPTVHRNYSIHWQLLHRGESDDEQTHNGPPRILYSFPGKYDSSLLLPHESEEKDQTQNDSIECPLGCCLRVSWYTCKVCLKKLKLEVWWEIIAWVYHTLKYISGYFALHLILS